MTRINCDQVGCKQEAKYAPKICVPAMGWSIAMHQPLAAIMGLKLCEKHCRKFPAKDQFYNEETRETWRTIFEIMARATGSSIPPDFERAFVTVVRLDSEEFLILERAQHEHK